MSAAPLDDLALTFEGADPQLEAELQSWFPDAIVSPADNFLGGLELAAVLRPAVDVIEKVLDFVTAWRDRYKDAVITIEGTKVDLKGYGPGDAIKILSAAGVAPERLGTARDDG